MRGRRRREGTPCRKKTLFEHTFLPLLSFPSAVLAFWAVGAGFYSLALFATLFGGLCLYWSAR